MVRKTAAGFVADEHEIPYHTSYSNGRTCMNPLMTEPTRPSSTPALNGASQSQAIASMAPQQDGQTYRKSHEAVVEEDHTLKDSFDPAKYALPYVRFMTENPTVYHAVAGFTAKLKKAGFKYLSERDLWDIQPGGKYYVQRNSSSFIAFAVGEDYEPGNGIAIVAGHIDALCAKLKPVSKLPTSAGYIQLGVAPYAGGMNSTWWDRDLGIGGRVLVQDNGKVEERLVKLDWPIARIPTLAPHFGAAAAGPFNKETQMVPIIGLDNSDLPGQAKDNTRKIEPNTFAATQPPRLAWAICSAMGISDPSTILNWELELFDTQPATLGGLDQEFIFAGRIDDKLCCYAAIEALLESSATSTSPSQIKMVGCFDNEEIGSYLRQGARSNFMSSTIDRIVESSLSSTSTTTTSHPTPINTTAQTLANTFLISSDVIHAFNPNFSSAYLTNHSPRLNIGVAVSADPNGHMTTDAASTALLQRIATKAGSTLQVFQIRNDSRSGGTIGPMTSSRLGCRAIDCGIPQLSMHSIRATTGSLDPGLGVKLYKGFFDFYEEVDREFRYD
jgi:aminopeptidase I